MTDQQGFLGRITAISRAHAVARFGKGGFGETKEHDKGDPLPPRVGHLVRVQTPRSAIYGIVSALAISSTEDDGGPRSGSMDIDLIGEVVRATDGPAAGFQRGISTAPALGAAVTNATAEDAEVVYATPSRPNIKIGKIHHADDLTAHLLVDDLLNKHFAILGTTGSGKSCAVTLFLRAILDSYRRGHVIVLDPHDEYKSAFGEQAELIGIDNLQLPYWMLIFDELKEILVSKSRDTRDSEIHVLKNALLKARREHSENSDIKVHITVDTPVPFRLSALKRNIDEEMGALSKADSSAPFMRLLARLDSLSTDPRYSFMFSGVMVRDILPDIMSRFLRLPVDGKPITIIDLSGVPGEVTDVVVSVLCRTIFDFCQWCEKKHQVPVLLVCEEAHRYIPDRAEAGFEPTKKAIARIAKEGRKYGVSLCLISQRPSELSTSILSQCGTLVALRLSNEQDLAFVRAALPEGASGLLAVLPALRSQEAVVVGEGVTVPVRVLLDTVPAEHLPSSSSAAFSTAWQRDAVVEDFVPQTVLRWRRQNRAGRKS